MQKKPKSRYTIASDISVSNSLLAVHCCACNICLGCNFMYAIGSEMCTNTLIFMFDQRIQDHRYKITREWNRI